MIAVYGPDIHQARSKTALILAIHAAVRGNKTLACEDHANSDGFGSLCPRSMLSQGLEFFTPSNLSTDNLTIAICSDDDPSTQAERLAATQANYDFVVCSCASNTSPLAKSPAGEVLVAAYEGQQLAEAKPLFETHYCAALVAALPYPHGRSRNPIVRRAAAFLPAIEHEVYELPLYLFPTLAALSESETIGSLSLAAATIMAAALDSEQRAERIKTYRANFVARPPKFKQAPVVPTSLNLKSVPPSAKQPSAANSPQNASQMAKSIEDMRSAFGKLAN